MGAADDDNHLPTMMLIVLIVIIGDIPKKEYRSWVGWVVSLTQVVPGEAFPCNTEIGEADGIKTFEQVHFIVLSLFIVIGLLLFIVIGLLLLRRQTIYLSTDQLRSAPI